MLIHPGKEYLLRGMGETSSKGKGGGGTPKGEDVEIPSGKQRVESSEEQKEEKEMTWEEVPPERRGREMEG